MSQLSVMYEHASERKITDMKFSAILHGADPKELEEKNPSKQKAVGSDNLLFGDPAEYAKMNEEDKKVISDKMKSKFMRWAGVKKHG